MRMYPAGQTDEHVTFPQARGLAKKIMSFRVTVRKFLIYKDFGGVAIIFNSKSGLELFCI